MKPAEQYLNYPKKDVIGRVPEEHWCAWLAHASEADKSDADFMRKLVVRRGECLRFAPDSLKSDPDVVLKAVRTCPAAFVYASDALQSDRRFVKQAINQSSAVLEYVKDAFRNDKSIALLAVRKNSGNIGFLPEEMQNDPDVIEASLGGNLYNLRCASEKARDNKEIALRALSRHGHVLEFLSDRLRADRDVVTAAVSSAWNALGFARGGLNDDREVVLTAVRHSGAALQFASDHLKDDHEIVLTAIENFEGNALEYASERLKDDRETVLRAVRRSEYAIAYASERLRHDADVISAVLDAFPGDFERLPEDVQGNLDFLLFGLESVVQHLPDPENYSFFEDATSEYYADYDRAEDDFLDILESVPREVLRKDPALSDRICRLAVEMDGAYYAGDYPYEDVRGRIVCLVEELYEEKDVPVRPILREAVDALRRESAEKAEARYSSFEPEERLFYENLDRYEKIVGRSVLSGGAEKERAYLSPGGGFVRHCMLSFVKDLVCARRGLYHDSAQWNDDGCQVDLDRVYDEIRARLSPEIGVVRQACEYYYSENVTVEVRGGIRLILVRAAPLKILKIWVNKQDSEHEHGKWLAPDRLGAFCDMVEHIRGIYGQYEGIAEHRAAELREKFGV